MYYAWVDSSGNAVLKVVNSSVLNDKNGQVVCKMSDAKTADIVATMLNAKDSMIESLEEATARLI